MATATVMAMATDILKLSNKMGLLDIFSNKKAINRSEILNGFCDNHIHLLPGVDDGIRSIDDSLKLLGIMENAGVKTVWCTPHIMEEISNKTDFLKMHFEKLKSMYKGGIELHLAAEYMIDSLFQERLESDDLLLHDNNHVLVECSAVSAPYNFKGTLKEIMSKGHYVLLAHPERYCFLDMKNYEELKSMKIKFQLNLTSLVGLYGSSVKEKAEKLLEAGFYNAVGTDTHRVKRWLDMEEQKLNKKIIKQVLEIPGL